MSDPSARELGLMLRGYLLSGASRRHLLEELWDRFAVASTPGEHALLGSVAYHAPFTGSADAERASEAARHALAGPHLAPGVVHPGVRHRPIWALEFCDRFTEAEQALREDLAHAAEVASRHSLRVRGPTWR